jgi:hypothetical protein
MSARSPGPLLNPTTYVLECKWGLVRKQDIDHLFEVLRNSKEFGIDTPEGRQIKQGVIGVFAGSAFNPNEKIRLKNEEEISLASYAARISIQLLKTSDFNEKLKQRGGFQAQPFPSQNPNLPTTRGKTLEGSEQEKRGKKNDLRFPAFSVFWYAHRRQGSVPHSVVACSSFYVDVDDLGWKASGRDFHMLACLGVASIVSCAETCVSGVIEVHPLEEPVDDEAKWRWQVRSNDGINVGGRAVNLPT